MNQIPPFTIDTAHAADGTAVVSVSGELDMRNAPQLAARLAEASARAVVVLDLSGCAFCDSAGLRVIMQAVQQAEERGGEMRLAGMTDMVSRVFELASLGFVSRFADVPSAVAG